MRSFWLSGLAIFAWCWVQTQLQAGEVASMRAAAPMRGGFATATSELEAGAGMFWSFTTRSSGNRPAINFQFSTLRYGWMLGEYGSGFWRGRGEFLIGAFGAPVTQGPGDLLVGGEIIWRHNFLRPGGSIIPYVQIGGGALYNDIHEDQNQIEVGGPCEFMLHAAAGVRFMLNESWSLNVEGGYRHTSNAAIYDRNAGLNSLGGTLGFSYLFY
jgi:hypothetical protein